LRFFATCAKGTEGALRSELSLLRLRGLTGSTGGVFFSGAIQAGMRACLCSRVAMRVLLQLAQFPAGDAADLYDGAKAIDWTEWLTLRHTFAVEATVTHSTLTHSQFTALKVKDAIVDAMRDRLGARPDVDAKDPDVRVVVHLSQNRADLSLDLAGQPLHRRGYRVAIGEAPLKETLAAAVLSLGRVAEDLPFVDPMCGSGTLPIEQALRVRQIPPGLGRAFGFQRWPSYAGSHQSLWDRMKEEARALVLPKAPVPILASDHSRAALDAAKKNAARAGVAADVVFEEREVSALERHFEKGTLCANPPYGERIMAKARAPELYRNLGRVLRRFGGWRAVFLSGHAGFEHEIGLRAKISHRLWNGPIEAKLLVFEIP
jgi:23S rRNA G2445 N2-methylase RlmL